MTRTAVLSDVHGNLEALEAVQAAAEQAAVGAWLCLGDVVGYGADPGACVAWAQHTAGTVLQGNHDAAVAGVQSVEYFNRYARRAVEWTQAQLSGPERAWLERLPLAHDDGGAYFVHAEPTDPGAWHYVDDEDDAVEALAAVDARLLFVGHTHCGFVCALESGRAATSAGAGLRQLEDGARYLVNVGSVGQPRDGDPRACFAVLDDEADTVELVRVDYDVPRAQAKILEAGLPRFLAERLGDGI